MENLELAYKFRWQIALIIFGAIVSSAGIYYFASGNTSKNDSIEIVQEDEETNGTEIIVEVTGAVNYPGVKKLKVDTRIEDALLAASGFSDDVDKEWVEKNINRAAKLTDGQKIYIPSIDEQSNVLSANKNEGYQNVSSQNSYETEEKVNINTATQKELENLWGIGPVYAQNIIEHRPYSTIEELVEKDIIKQNVYDRNKDLLTVY